MSKSINDVFYKSYFRKDVTCANDFNRYTHRNGHAHGYRRNLADLPNYNLSTAVGTRTLSLGSYESF